MRAEVGTNTRCKQLLKHESGRPYSKFVASFSFTYIKALDLARKDQKT